MLYEPRNAISMDVKPRSWNMIQVGEKVQIWMEDTPAKNEGIQKRWWMWSDGLGLGMWP